MDTIASAIAVPAAGLRHRRVRLKLGPGAAHACGHVSVAITAWNVPVDQVVAVLLASDLVINEEQAGTTPTQGAASPRRGMGRGSLPRDTVNSGDGEP
jgi:hypothetical protein